MYSNTYWIEFLALVAAFILLFSFVIWQFWENKKLVAENADLKKSAAKMRSYIQERDLAGWEGKDSYDKLQNLSRFLRPSNGHAEEIAMTHEFSMDDEPDDDDQQP